MPDAQGNPPEANPPPRPPRRRVLRPILAAARRRPLLTFIALLLAAVGGMRLWWGWHTGRQLAAQVEEIRRRGEPTEAPELTVEPLPDAQNAWAFIMRAAAFDTSSAPANTPLEYPSYPPYGAPWEQAAATSERTNARVFQLARKARDLDRAQLHASYPSPMFLTLYPGLNNARAISNTLADGATHRHLRGDDPEAIERLRDTLHVARSLHQDDAAISQMVAIGVTALAYSRATMIAPGLRMESPETRRATRELIADLLDERAAVEGFRRSFVFERVATTDYQRWQSSGAWVLRPLADREIVRTNEAADVYAAAARESNAPAARRVLAALPAREAAQPDWSGIFGGTWEEQKIPRYSRWYATSMFQLDRYFEQHYRGLADRRAAAVSLAAQLYRFDHGGRWPDRLEQLVPDYLPAVPSDPFHEDGRPIGYVVLKGALPDGGDRPLVYFDSGTLNDASVIDTEPVYDWHQDPQQRRPRQDVRQYRDLARWSPTTRRFDEALRVQEEAELLQREEEERERREWEAQEMETEAQEGAGGEPAESSSESSSDDLPEAVDDDPGQSDAPGDDAEEQDEAQD